MTREECICCMLNKAPPPPVEPKEHPAMHGLATLVFVIDHGIDKTRALLCPFHQAVLDMQRSQ